MQDLISVIVPIYKVETYLDECVQSILSQTHKQLEIILVDDGSPDGCPAMCDAWAEKDSRIRVIHKENGGLSDARNVGIDAATGDYIAFVDSDDWIVPEMYEKMLAALKKENADICACNILSCFPDRTCPWGCGEYTVGGPEQFLKMIYSDTSFPVAAWNKLYPRRMWEEIRFPVGKICEDAFTTYRLVHHAQRIVQIPEALYCYRIRENSIMTSAFRFQRMDEEEAWRVNYEFIRDNYPNLKKTAFDFYLQKVSILIHTIPREERAHYAAEYTYLKNILKKKLGYLVFSSGMGPKKRIKLLLDYCML